MAQGPQFQVNTYTTGNQDHPSVAADADGDFVVAWRSFGSVGNDASGYSVQAQRYASDGMPQGSQFQVNTYTTDGQGEPRVAIEANGDFVVVWGSNGSFGTDSSYSSVQRRRYASNGTPLEVDFQINTYTTGFQGDQFLAEDADGDFIVVWLSGPGTSIQAQRYASDGMPRGPQFQVNTYNTNLQSEPRVAADTDGDFVVVWESYGSEGGDSDGSIQGQRYASDGMAQGSEFQVNTYTTNEQDDGFVAVHADGDFVAVWSSLGSVGTDNDLKSSQGQRYASDGTAQGSEFQINTYTTGENAGPSSAAQTDRGFVVVWTSDGSAETDSSGDSIQGQRYALPPKVPSLSAAGAAAVALMMVAAAALALRWRSRVRSAARR
jgi:hypothetical protein